MSSEKICYLSDISGFQEKAEVILDPLFAKYGWVLHGLCSESTQESRTYTLNDQKIRVHLGTAPQDTLMTAIHLWCGEDRFWDDMVPIEFLSAENRSSIFKKLDMRKKSLQQVVEDVRDVIEQHAVPFLKGDKEFVLSREDEWLAFVYENKNQPILGSKNKLKDRFCLLGCALAVLFAMIVVTLLID